ncbi:CGNR zinc finger domain-containing protein [Kribbella sancticallisti]|uniref:CGNR zinc finger domain-containing protein n=1 Tax=Kribbella sancticallisti TaxID=460087 RepID=UPI003CD052F5
MPGATLPVATRSLPAGVSTVKCCRRLRYSAHRGRARAQPSTFAGSGLYRRWCSMQICGNQAKAARYRSSHP